MTGIENILSIISSQQKQTEKMIISSAEKKADGIITEGNEKAAKEYEEYLKKAKVQLALVYDNAISSVNAQMKRRELAYKVKCIDNTAEKVIERLNSLPDSEYSAVLEKLLLRKADGGKGMLFLNKKDLSRLTDSFRNTAKKLNVEISEECAGIENGFILTYGLISENCSFRAIIEAERDSVRDIISRELFEVGV